jgi:hypothetical protein
VFKREKRLRKKTLLLNKCPAWGLAGPSSRAPAPAEGEMSNLYFEMPAVFYYQNLVYVELTVTQVTVLQF